MNLLKIILKHTATLPESEQVHFFEEMNALHLEESKELIKRKFRKVLSQEFELERMGGFAQKLHQLQAQNHVLILEKRAIQNNNTHMFITINAWTSKVTLETFMKKCHKIAKKTCFSKCLYVFEQRGTIEKGDVGQGYHCHILVQRNLKYKVCKCCDNVKYSAKNLVKNVKLTHLLNFQICGKEYAIDKKNYILGQNKTGENKDIKQEADIKWRTAEAINAFYGDENII